MKSAFLFLLVIICVSGCSSAKPKQSQSKNSKAVAVSDGKILYELGRLDESKEKLLAVLKVDPKNPEAQYYLSLIEKSQASPRTPRFWYQTIPPQPVY